VIKERYVGDNFLPSRPPPGQDRAWTPTFYACSHRAGPPPRPPGGSRHLEPPPRPALPRFPPIFPDFGPGRYFGPPPRPGSRPQPPIPPRAQAAASYPRSQSPQKQASRVDLARYAPLFPPPKQNPYPHASNTSRKPLSTDPISLTRSYWTLSLIAKGQTCSQCII
jgi:hypothetical protein